MANGGEISVDLALRVQGIQEAIARVAAQFRTLGTQLAGSLGSAPQQAIIDTDNRLREFGNRAGGYFKDVSRIITGILISQAFYKLLSTIEEATSALFTFNAQMEQAAISFSILLGSDEEAKQFIGVLEDFAATTPFEMRDAARGAQRLMAMGFAAENVVPILRSVTDASAVLGGTPETIDRITRALGQMHTRGKIAAQELIQLSEAGIPALQILKEELGLTNDQLGNIGKMKISGDIGVAALIAGIDKRFSGASARIARTTTGLMSTIKDNLLLLSRATFLSAFEAIRGSLESMADGLTHLRMVLRNTGIKGLFLELVPPGMRTTVQMVIQGFIGLGTQIKALGRALAPLAQLIGAGFLKALAMILPFLNLLLIGLTRLANAANGSNEPLRLLIRTLVGLGIVSVLAPLMVKFLGVIAKFNIFSLAAMAVTKLVTAIKLLSLAMTRNPIIALISVISMVLIGLALSSKTASEWLDNVYKKIAALAGLDVAEILAPEDPNAAADYLANYNSALDGTTGGLDDMTDAAKKAKAAQDNLQSFDEVHVIKDDAGDGDDVPKVPKVPDVPVTKPKKQETGDTRPGLPRDIELPEFHWPVIPPFPPMPPITPLTGFAEATEALLLRIRLAWKAAYGAISVAAVGIGVALGGIFTEGYKKLSEDLQKMIDRVKERMGQIKESLLAPLRGIGPAFGEAFAFIGLVITEWWARVLLDFEQFQTGWSEAWANVKVNAGLAWESLWKGAAETLSNIWPILLVGLAAIGIGLLIFFGGLQVAIGLALVALIVVVKDFFLGVGTAAASETNNAKVKVVGIWDQIRISLSNIWSGIVDGAGNAFRRLVDAVKTPINYVIGLLNGFVSRFNSVSVSLPSVTVPGLGTIGGYTLKFPQIPRIPMLENGGIITKDQIYRGGEGNKAEAVIPLTGNRMQPFADAIAQGILGSLGDQKPSSGGGSGGVNLQVGILVGDERSYRELERKLRSLRLGEQARGAT